VKPGSQRSAETRPSSPAVNLTLSVLMPSVFVLTPVWIMRFFPVRPTTRTVAASMRAGCESFKASAIFWPEGGGTRSLSHSRILIVRSQIPWLACMPMGHVRAFWFGGSTCRVATPKEAAPAVEPFCAARAKGLRMRAIATAARVMRDSRQMNSAYTNKIRRLQGRSNRAPWRRQVAGRRGSACCVTVALRRP